MIRGYNSLHELNRSPALDGVHVRLDPPAYVRDELVEVDIRRIATIAQVAGIESLAVLDQNETASEMLTAARAEKEHGTPHNIRRKPDFAAVVGPWQQHDGSALAFVAVNQGLICEKLMQRGRKNGEGYEPMYAQELDIVLRRSLRWIAHAKLDWDGPIPLLSAPRKRLALAPKIFGNFSHSIIG